MQNRFQSVTLTSGAEVWESRLLHSHEDEDDEDLVDSEMIDGSEDEDLSLKE